MGMMPPGGGMMGGGAPPAMGGAPGGQPGGGGDMLQMLVQLLKSLPPDQLKQLIQLVEGPNDFGEPDAAVQAPKQNNSAKYKQVAGGQ